MKTLILGAKGMLGQELVKAFADHELTAWDREECDVLTPVSEEKIRSLAPDLIVNAVAYNDVDRAEEEGKELAYKLNAEAPGNLARIARELNTTFVHYGTDFVFDGEKGSYSEEDEPHPISVYGASKLKGEQAVLASGARAYVIRLARLFGKPAVSEGGKKSFVDLMLDLASKKDHLNLVDDEIASPTYALDLARATREIVEKYPPGLYHAANSGKCSWYEFAKEIFRLKDMVIDISPVSGKMFPRAASRPHDASLVSIKLPLQRLWQEALNEYLL
ncbi:dTDP-4-dehydrorhamnose reductase [Candidatus Uhrbacteria bacterium]|nr:dTDP-4-dehydrorhamnose reductase [Candidatus Uhrbacteria bacterium]